MRGRKPKPAAVKKAEGNPGKRKLNRAELLEDPEAPRAPAYLSPVARQEWKKLVPILASRRTMARVDTVMMANFCEAVALLRLARRQLAKTPEAGRLIVSTASKVVEHTNNRGRVTKREISGGNIQVNPLLYVIRDQVATIARLAAEFGLSPASRARLAMEDHSGAGERPGKDPLEAILSGPVERDSSDPIVH